MSNLHLVTGHAGKTHVTSADHGSFYAALFGSNNYILDKGSKFAASIISDNLVKIADGDLLMQGRHARIPDNEFVEVVIPNGTQGYKRRDLIVARYTKDVDTGVEEMDLIVLIGEPIAAEPKDPAYITGDLIKDGAVTNDLPLYRVNLDGTTITGLDSLMPAVIPSVLEKLQDIDATVNDIKTLVSGSIATFQSGSYTGTGTTGSSSPNTIVFARRPKIIYIMLTEPYTGTTASYVSGAFAFPEWIPGSYAQRRIITLASNGSDVSTLFARYVASTNTLQFYSEQSTAYEQLNAKDKAYEWLAID